jgi:hypothetical protein
MLDIDIKLKSFFLENQCYRLFGLIDDYQLHK